MMWFWFLLVACVTLITNVSGDTKSQVVCQYDKITISCPDAISIQSAMWGRLDNTICLRNYSGSGLFLPYSEWIQITNCSSNSSLNTAKATCEGRSNCTPTVDQYFFGNPCPGVPKYLEITVSCQGNVSITTPMIPARTTTQPPSQTKSLVVCQGTNMTVSCPRGVISIQSSTFGRLDTITCPGYNATSQLQTATCNSSSSLALSKEFCDGRSICLLEARWFFDPLPDSCPNIYKYLAITWSCQALLTTPIPTSHPVAAVPQVPYEPARQRPESGIGPRATVTHPPSVFDKNPWLLWTLTGIAVVVTVAICICCRFCFGGKISEIEEGKEDKFAGYRLGRRPISVGPPKPI